MASVTPRRNPSGTVIWRVQYRVDGRMTQDNFTTERAAREYGRLVDRVGGAAARAVRYSRHDTNEIPTLREWTATYLDPTKGWLTGVTPGTRDDYERLAERSFLAMLGDIPIDVLSKQDVARWVHWQEQQPPASGRAATVSAKTVRNYHAVLSSVLSAAVEANHVPGNVARGVKLTPGVRQEMVILTEEELERIVALMPEHYRPLTLFLAGTGMRWGEATALTWGDITPAVVLPDGSEVPPTARVTKAWKRGPGGNPVLGTPKTRKSIRTVSLWAELLDVLGDRGPAPQLVFRGMGRGDEEGRRMWSERFHKSAWDPAVAAAGLGKRPRIHDLRHTHASWLLGSGMPISYVQARLGHEKSTTTVDVYGHLLPDAHLQMSDAAAARMGRVLRPTPSAPTRRSIGAP